MTRITRPLTAILAAATVIGTAGAAQAETAPTWQNPQVLQENAEFQKAAASSGGNIWATGAKLSGGTPIAWRSNGSAWSQVSLPSGTKEITDISASTVHNTWVLDAKSSTHLRKWDNGTWSVPGTGQGKGVTAIGAAASNQVWAGGTGFIRHFTGSKWTEKKLGSAVSIEKIQVNHDNDIWAVGHRDLGPGGGFEVRQRPYAMHWNGASWTVTSVPGYPADGGDGDLEKLNGVAFAGTGDVYASGYSSNRDEDSEPILVHWNGTTWSKVNTALDGGGIYGLAPAQAGGLWALRAEYTEPIRPQYRSTDGTWTSPELGGTNAQAYSLLRVPGSDRTIAVGGTGRSEGPGGDAVVWSDN